MNLRFDNDDTVFASDICSSDEVCADHTLLIVGYGVNKKNQKYW